MNYKISVIKVCLFVLIIVPSSGYARSVAISPDNGAVIIDGSPGMIPQLEKNPNARVEDFNKDLEYRGIEGKITDCSDLITLSNGGGRDVSYGAVCKLQTSKKTGIVTLCNDDMVGHFTMEYMSSEAGKAEFHTFKSTKAPDSLVEFTAFNCIGG